VDKLNIIIYDEKNDKKLTLPYFPPLNKFFSRLEGPPISNLDFLSIFKHQLLPPHSDELNKNNKL